MHKVSRFFKPLPCPTPAPKKLYLLKCEATGLYKIGATSEDVKNRISKLYYNSHTDQRTIKIIKVWEKCGYCEYYILNSFAKLKVSHPFYKNGHTEWFKFTSDESSLIRTVESIISSLEPCFKCSTQNRRKVSIKKRTFRLMESKNVIGRTFSHSFGRI